jgi:carbon-monoxide dehydrogenase medium subunit
VIPVAFDYHRAQTVEAALAVLAENGDEAKLMAGGHSLLPMMRFRLAVPSVIVDIDRLSELSYVRDAGDHLAIGALTRHCVVERDPAVLEHAPLLAKVTAHVGDPQVRHRGTIGGSLAHADSAADTPSALLALGGSVVVRSASGGDRLIAATDLFTGFLQSAITDEEIITEVRIPKATSEGWGFQKFNRRAQDWAIVGVSAQRVGDSGRVALVNMGPTPMRAVSVEAALAGGATAAEAAEQAAEGTEPTSDLNASISYRQHLARVLVKRALIDAGF